MKGRSAASRRIGFGGFGGFGGSSLIVIGVVLLGLSIVGPRTPLAQYDNRDARPWESFDPALAQRARTPAALAAEARVLLPSFDRATDRQRMDALYDVVAARFTHSNGARHTLGTNWLLFLAGQVVRPFGLIWDPAVYLASGHSLVCSQSSYLLLQLALDEGIPARHVGLIGHVVMEAWYDGDWHLYDPDTEATPVQANGDIPSVEELALDRDLLERAYTGENAQYVDIIASRENNTYMSYPVGTHFTWQAEVLALIERVAQVLKYVLPLLLIGAGAWWTVRTAGRRSDDA